MSGEDEGKKWAAIVRRKAYELFWMEVGGRNFFFTVRHRREEMLLSLSLFQEETTFLHSFFFDLF